MAGGVFVWLEQSSNRGIILMGVATTAYVQAQFAAGTWTPTISFTTPGDLAVTYGQQEGAYFKLTNMVIAFANVSTTAFTHATAAGSLRLEGFPFTSISSTSPLDFRTSGPVTWDGITMAGYTDIGTTMGGSNDFINFRASGSGVANANVSSSNVPSGGTVNLRCVHIYWTDTL